MSKKQSALLDTLVGEVWEHFEHTLYEYFAYSHSLSYFLSGAKYFFTVPIGFLHKKLLVNKEYFMIVR